ncbi:MAG: S8 family serine peptidase, partial [Deltaproteobacteria bacterium]|nr:S8 family serine peptidase [Deltaproteobacteria bacterium]
IAAPGASILTTNRGGGYGYWNGTSFSSPVAAGLAGLIISANPDLTNTQVVEIITQNADDLGDPGFDQYYGYGRVNACASLVAAIGTAPEPEPDITDPLVSIASPEEGSTVSSSITVRVSATDNVGVERVELNIDGTFFGTSTTDPYNVYWDTSDLPEGYYELSATAYDTSENIAYSNSVIVYVHNQQEQDIIPPVVSITSPADGAHLSKLVKITVLASDNIGVTRMQLYIDGLLRVDKQASVISWPWNVKKASNGEHIISSKAYDAAGNNVGIDSITVYK